MSRQWISTALRTAVRTRAGDGCEYCRIPGLGVFFEHEPDHVIAEQHGGGTTLDNLALACAQCNRAKGPNIASMDPDTKQLVPIFNPRTDNWSAHFRVDHGRIVALTPIGRATARLLNFSDRDREEARRKLWLAGRYRV
jgi:hypothetical protein